MTLVRSRFGDEVRQAVAEALIPVVYRRAVDETQIRPVEDPEFRGAPARGRAASASPPSSRSSPPSRSGVPGVTARHSPQPVTEADVETDALRRSRSSGRRS